MGQKHSHMYIYDIGVQNIIVVKTIFISIVLIYSLLYVRFVQQIINVNSLFTI